MCADGAAMMLTNVMMAGRSRFLRAAFGAGLAALISPPISSLSAASSEESGRLRANVGGIERVTKGA